MTPEQAYKAFCGELVRNFDRDWDKVGRHLDYAYRYLERIPVHAWQPMAEAAVREWERWPTNWVKAVNKLFDVWRKTGPIESDVKDCEYCNGYGFFSSYERREVKPGVFMRYWYTWRCGGCSNWYGVLGDMVGRAYPLEVQTRLRHELHIYVKPTAAEMEYRRNASRLSAGTQVNRPTPRPAVQREHYQDRD